MDSQSRESLTRLLLRLSEGGTPAILPGTLAKAHQGKEFQELLNRRVIIEQEPASHWPTCDDCDCGLDYRPIREKEGGGWVARCPSAARADVHLDAQDIRSFEIDTWQLIQEIRSASGLADEPDEIANGIWLLGACAGRAVFVSFATGVVRDRSIVQTLRAAAQALPITLLGAGLSASEARRLSDGDIFYSELREALTNVGAGPLALDVRMLVPGPDSTIVPRLVLRQSERWMKLDALELPLSDRNFRLLWLLSEALHKGAPIVSREQIGKSLRNTKDIPKSYAADAIHDLREQIKRGQGRKAEYNDLIQTRQSQGYALALRPGEVQLFD